jgi:hypothetical protein
MMQLRDFDPSKAGTIKYYCLRNVRLGYGIAPKYDYAWQAWQNSPQYTTPIPKGLEVPVYFSFTATLDGVRRNWGHIAVQMANGQVWTDGRYYNSVQDLVSNYLSNGQYVGWSTHVNGVQVINNKGELMDTDAKVQAQYYTLRGNNGTANERKGWIGRSYEEFNATARPEVQGRTANITNLTNAVKTLTTERNQARTQVATLTKEVLAERDKVQVLQADKNRLQAEIDGAKEAYKQLEAQHQTKIDELNKVIEIKDKEIIRLTKELDNCQTTDGDSSDMSGWQLIKAGLVKLWEGIR